MYLNLNLNNLQVYRDNILLWVKSIHSIKECNKKMSRELRVELKNIIEKIIERYL